ncbi:hypothetical protein HO173_005029 [Letharia columbiana]|uniref:Secreted protein n=1 Tax=Letharia columbiana TaxID=112416 RepID=A0A8H6L5T9_9LECA|nr:uncharacterized protein HO173_005029 [Letharia columbiana]KAF6236738.1 hypothetical protein HO173_005029 [Letharia columbiana]
MLGFLAFFLSFSFLVPKESQSSIGSGSGSFADDSSVFQSHLRVPVQGQPRQLVRQPP